MARDREYYRDRTRVTSQTLELRRKAHVLFDCLWLDEYMTRDDAYTRLHKWTGEWHIKHLTDAKCHRVMEEVRKLIPIPNNINFMIREHRKRIREWQRKHNSHQ